jgi:hypothetical protein
MFGTAGFQPALRSRLKTAGWTDEDKGGLEARAPEAVRECPSITCGPRGW